MPNLTSQEKIMNMLKLGTVSLYLPLFKNTTKLSKTNVLREILYTLCVFQDARSRYGSGYGCLFYRILIYNTKA